MSDYNGDCEVFDLQPQEYYFKLKQKKSNPQEEDKFDLYVLVEFDGKQRDAYLSAMNRRMKSTPTRRDEVPDFRSIDGIQADLLTRCIFHVECDDEGNPIEDEKGQQIRRPIKADLVQSWRSGLLQQIHNKATELCAIGLGEEEEATAKND